MKKNITGIYSITNKINGLIYVGSSVKCIKTRWSYHLRDLRANKHHSFKLQNSYNKYGENSFKFKVLEVIEDTSIILDAEQKYLDNLKPFFNINPVAVNCTGRKFSEESKKKMSESAKKRGLPEALKRQQEPKIGPKKPKRFNRKSRAVEGARKAYALRLSKPIVATSGTETIEFESKHSCIRDLCSKFPKINRFGIRRAIKLKTEYYGYKWSYKCQK